MKKRGVYLLLIFVLVDGMNCSRALIGSLTPDEPEAYNNTKNGVVVVVICRNV